MSGLNSYAGSSNIDVDNEGVGKGLMDDKGQAAKGGKLKQKPVKKPILHGTSPIKEIGKQKKVNKNLKASILNAFPDLKQDGRLVEMHDGAGAGAVVEMDGKRKEDEVVAQAAGVPHIPDPTVHNNLTGSQEEARQEQ